MFSVYKSVIKGEMIVVSLNYWADHMFASVIPSPLLGQRTKAVKLKYECLRDIYLPDPVASAENFHVQILFGLDYFSVL